MRISIQNNFHIGNIISDREILQHDEKFSCTREIKILMVSTLRIIQLM